MSLLQGHQFQLLGGSKPTNIRHYALAAMAGSTGCPECSLAKVFTNSYDMIKYLVLMYHWITVISVLINDHGCQNVNISAGIMNIFEHVCKHC